MGVPVDQIVPWGRSYEEYLGMFALSDEDLGKRILGCGDGPAAFNAVLSARGGRIVSVDPIYAFSPEAIRSRIADTCDTILREIHHHLDEYVWTTVRSPEELGRVRMAAMDVFLDDFTGGSRQGRYVAAALPQLPFASRSFDLALCSHLLFTYTDHLSTAFHLDATLEMCRVAEEVRIFPLVATSGEISAHLAPLQDELARRGYATEIRTVPYLFQVDGNEMLVVRAGRFTAAGVHR